MNNQFVTTTPPEDAGVSASHGLFSSAPFLALFWKPRFMPFSPVLMHVPMLFWLVSALCPRRIAMLGVGDGVAHFALCQGAEKLALKGGGSCVGYGYWADSKSGKANASVPPALGEHQSMLYEDVSRLVAARGPADALEELLLSPVDLLCVDLESLPGGAVVSADSVANAVTESGILVLLGTHTLDARVHDGAGFLRLINARPSVKFDGETEAVVLMMGDSVPGSLNALLGSVQGTKLKSGAESVFRRSGQGLLATARVDELVRARTKVRRALAGAETALKDEQVLVSKARETSEVQAQKIAELQVELFSLQQQCAVVESNHVQSLDNIKADRDRLQERVRKCEEDMAVVASQRDDAIADAQAAHSQRDEATSRYLDEVTEITRISEEWRAQVKESRVKERALSADVESLRSLLDETLGKVKQQRESKHQMSAGLRALIKSLRKELRMSQRIASVSKQKADHLEQQIEELLSSTSWKITKPLREAKSKWFMRGVGKE